MRKKLCAGNVPVGRVGDIPWIFVPETKMANVDPENGFSLRMSETDVA
jgi:hypothetical protein